jgi:hypothetical protein
MLDYPPLILFCYNRPDHLANTISSLLRCENSEKYDIHIFSDGPKYQENEDEILQVRSLIKKICGFNSIKIYESQSNLGLANSVILGVSKILLENQSVIVIEDDLEFDENFLNFMRDALNRYETNNAIFSVSGFSPIDVSEICFPNESYLSPRIHSWGWGIWADQWNKIDWELSNLNSFFRDNLKVKHFVSGGPDLVPMVIRHLYNEIDSWAIRMAIAASDLNRYCVYPAWTLVNNHGLDGSGTNCGIQDDTNLRNDFKNIKITKFVESPIINSEILKRFRNAYS